MIVEVSVATAAATAATWGLRALVHRAMLRGLRAPRLPHALTGAELGVPATQVGEWRIAGPRGRSLFGCLVMPGPDGDAPVPAVLVMHGWGANAALMAPVVQPLHAAGFAVLLIDARCHGRSDDEDFTSLPRFAEDIAAGLAWLRARSDIDGDRLALLGHSVGAGAALWHAAQHDDVRAVVSLSAFAHPREVMRRFLADKSVPYPVLGWYVMRHVQRVIGHSFDEIAPLTTIARVRCPVLLVHGRHDATVPLGDAQRLHAVSSHAQLLAVDGDHDLREALLPHAAKVADFLRTACGDTVNARTKHRGTDRGTSNGPHASDTGAQEPAVCGRRSSEPAAAPAGTAGPY